MRIIGVDAPRGWSCIDVPRIGKAQIVALGTLDEGRECEDFAAMIAKYSPERAIVEAPLEPYIGGKAANGSPAVRRAIVTSLLAVARLSGELRQVARSAGIRCDYVDAATVRHSLGIRGKDESELDRAVKAHVAMVVQGWPKVSNVDERDSAAACLYAAHLV